MARVAASKWRTDTFARWNEPLAELLGDKTAAPLAKLGLGLVRDLMTHLPYRYLAGTETTDLADLEPGENVALVARVARVERRGQDPRARLEVVLTDGQAALNATFFGRQRYVEHWQRQLSLGVKGIFVGKVGVFNGNLQLTHPDFVMLDESGRIVGRASAERKQMADQVSRAGLVGIYPASAKLPTWQIAECTSLVLDHLRGIADPLPDKVRAAAGVMGLEDALVALHRPALDAPIAAARERLKFDEALALQVTMVRRRAEASGQRAEPIETRSDGLLATFDEWLPFTLTAGQQAVSAELFSDLAKDTPMQRLLQGEVGSGKTIVALRAMLACVDAGRQAVLLAPTEVLATQHHETIRGLLGDLGAGRTLGAPEDATDVVLLTGSLGAAARRSALDRIASGEAGIIIGTHALLSAGVEFAGLGLVVVDEQHRFGVEQRARLSAKSPVHPHVLVMTATPIPRSVAMTVFGDLEVSTLAELPAGRAAVQTSVVPVRAHPNWLDRVWQRVREEVAAGRQAFVVAPRITATESDVVPDGDEGAQPSATVDELSVSLAEGPLDGLRLGVLHGRLSPAEKDEVMRSFAGGDLDVLVTTTVIEVGVDVPNASAMVVMDADRFGISQLHQLRGRIGRGQHEGICLLVTNAAADSPAAERLTAVASTRDGFELANLDLAQRREGDVLGASQAGSRSTLRLLRVIDDADLIERARQVAIDWVADPAADADVLADIVTQTEQDDRSDWLDRN